MTRKFDFIDRLIPIGINVNRDMNMCEHSTDKYDLETGIVLRQGKVFSFVIILNQVFDENKYQLAIIFKSITWKNAPDIRIPIDSSSNGWSIDMIAREKEIYLQIQSSTDALIGKYAILLEIKSKDENQYSLFQFNIDIYFLFNPWLNKDIYGSLSSDEINEYVMNENGKIILNSSHIPKMIHWHFGQFQNVVLQTTLAILNREQISSTDQINLPFILHILAENICSDTGTIHGIFPSLTDSNSVISQDYGDTSTITILERFCLLDNQGTNWQHAAIFCSLCRSLGIPSRIVTIFDEITEQQIDNSWYIWNECWIEKSSEWHFIDPSSKIRYFDLCPISTIRNLNILELSKLINKNNVKILTKSLKKDQDFEDITNNYKSLNISQQDVEIDINIDDKIKGIGLILSTNNLSDQVRTLSIEIKLNRLSPSDDKKYIFVQSFSEIIHLDSHQSKVIRIKLVDTEQLWREQFQLDIRAIIKETGQIYQTEKSIQKMKLFFDNDVIKLGESARLNIQINNMSFHSWNNGQITINGFGVFECFPIKQESASQILIEMIPLRKGISQVYVTFKTDSISLPTQAILLEVTELLNQNLNERENVKLLEIKPRELLKIPSIEDLPELTLKTTSDSKKKFVSTLSINLTNPMTIKKQLRKIPSLENITEAISSITIDGDENMISNSSDKTSNDQQRTYTDNESNKLRHTLNSSSDIEIDKNVTSVPIVNNDKQNDIERLTQRTQNKTTEQVPFTMNLNDWLEDASRNLLTNNQSDSDIYLSNENSKTIITDNGISELIDELELIANKSNQNESIPTFKKEILEEIKRPMIDKIQKKPIRTYSNATIDLESILSDPSVITTISDQSSASEDEELSNRQRTSTVIENRSTRSETMTTIKNRDSSSSSNDDILPDFPNSSVNVLSLYAEFLACKIIGSALYVHSDECTTCTHAFSNPLYDSS